MPRIPKHDHIGQSEGLLNRNMLRNSPPGEVKTYYLTEEERLAAIKKYGPILMPLKRHRSVVSTKRSDKK